MVTTWELVWISQGTRIAEFIIKGDFLAMDIRQAFHYLGDKNGQHLQEILLSHIYVNII
jgi:hypothetical protein